MHGAGVSSPDHNPDESTQPSMRACHKTQQQFVAPVLPAFIPPVIDIVAALEPVAFEPAFTYGDPHPAPAPRRPDAPS